MALTTWLTLLFVGTLEPMWVLCLERSHGGRHILPGVIALAAIILQLVLLSRVLTTVPPTTVYIITVGFGTIATALASFVFSHETFSFIKLASIAFIALGVIGLRASEGA